MTDANNPHEYVNRVRLILEYCTRNPRLSPTFFESLMKQHENGQLWSEKQRDAINRVWDRWRIESWQARKSRELTTLAEAASV
jgi:hypothetical protein